MVKVLRMKAIAPIIIIISECHSGLREWELIPTRRGVRGVGAGFDSIVLLCDQRIA
jgi:hypothetical protein